MRTTREIRHGHRASQQRQPLRFCVFAVVFIFLIPYTAALYNGLSSLFSTAFGFDQYWVWILIISVITGLYVIIGGLMSTAVNSFIQGIIMLVGIVLVVFFALQKNGGFTDSRVTANEDKRTLNNSTT